MGYRELAVKIKNGYSSLKRYYLESKVKNSRDFRSK